MSASITTLNVSKQKVTVTTGYEALITGINTLLPGVDPFVIASATMSRADLLAKLQGRLDAANATKAALLAHRQAVEAERASDAVVRPLRAQLKVYLQGRFGKTNTQLQSFGFTPNKVPLKTVLAKATGVAKAAATRVARHTLGKKQKAAIHGAVPESPAPADAPR
jgi:hypothetical protein